MPPSGVDYASEFLNGYAPEYVANSTEFSAKILQDFYSCYEIWFELLAKVSIIGATHNNSHAYAHHGLSQKY